jgi:beta-phosphoglucomutase-like phosphatase (HAD superfamily)
MGLLEFFIATIAHEDGMETKSQRYLSAAIKLGRPPDHCVVFGTCLAGVTAAHNCTMKVSMLVRDVKPAYSLHEKAS